MRMLARFLARLRASFTARALDAELDAELAHHLFLLTEEGIRDGQSPDEAARQARIALGGIEQARERHREARSFLVLEQIGKEVAGSLRTLFRSRGYTFTVVSMLTLGIVIATITCQLTSWILIDGLPYPRAEELRYIGLKDKRQGISGTWCPAGLFPAYWGLTTVFSEFATATPESANVVVGDDLEVVTLVDVSVDSFRTLGVQPALGRAFRPEEFHAGANHVVVITDQFWHRRFGGAADVLGRSVLVDGEPCTVVGVMRPIQLMPIGFHGEIYRPLALAIDPAASLATGGFIIGRLRDGVTAAQARVAVAALKPVGLDVSADAWLAHQEPVLSDLWTGWRSDAFWIIAAAGALLFGMVCLNASNLVLLRMINRHRELGIRLALGGTRWQIARLLIIEGGCLGAMATLAAVTIARWFPAIHAAISGNEAAKFNPYWDAPTLLLIGGGGLLASLVLALVPLMRLRGSELSAVMKSGGTVLGDSRDAIRLRQVLIIGQAALAVLLLSGAGLLLKSFDRVRSTRLGFDPTGLVKVTVTLPRGRALPPESRLQLFENLQRRLAALPGVRSVSYGQDALLTGGHGASALVLLPDGSTQAVAGSFVAANFAETARLVVKRGRWFSGRRNEFAAVINESFAKQCFGAVDPVGRSFRLLSSDDHAIPIVGVVADVKDGIRSNGGMRYYVPAWAYPPGVDTLLLQFSAEPPKTVDDPVRRAIREINPHVIVSQVASINELVAASLSLERYVFRLLCGGAVLAVGLAVVGLFSVVRYTVDTRLREFGIRRALGAPTGSLRRLVLRGGLVDAAVGLAIGIGASLALTRYMQSLLFETKPSDPTVYAGVALLLLAAAVVACWMPARRAGRVNVADLLRTE